MSSPRADRVVIALMPPLVQLRTLELPPLRPDQAQLVVSRDIRQYFAGNGESLVATVRTAPRKSAGSATVAAASDELLRAIEVAAESTGWRIERIVPAHEAWRMAAMAQATEQASIVALVDQGDSLGVMSLEGGELISWRRVRKNAPKELLAELGRPSEAPEPRSTGFVLFERLQQDGAGLDAIMRAQGLPFAIQKSASGETVYAAQSAAEWAPAARDLSLVSSARRRARDARASRVQRTLIGIGAAGLMFTAAMEFVNANRELSAASDARAAIRPQVAALLSIRDSIARVAALSDVIGRSAGSAAELIPQIETVVAALPADVVLSAATWEGDSLSIEGTAMNSRELREALLATPRIASVRATTSLRLERSEDGTTIERFSSVVKFREHVVLPAATATGATP